jgi:hypothetical protein
VKCATQKLDFSDYRLLSFFDAGLSAWYVLQNDVSSTSSNHNSLDIIDDELTTNDFKSRIHSLITKSRQHLMKPSKESKTLMVFHLKPIF